MPTSSSGFWRADAGLFFLLGLIRAEPGDGWGYHAFWAHDLAEEGVATLALIEFLVARRAAQPGMHVYHYNHTERSALERLAADHGVGEVALDGLIETGLFVDLLVVARNALVVGTESYSLKHLERLTDFERGHDIDQGAGAVVEYEEWRCGTGWWITGRPTPGGAPRGSSPTIRSPRSTPR